jgi:hypothetical protein
MKFHDLDVVRTIVAKDYTLAGSVGTVVCVLDNPHEAYIVEFVNDDGETLDSPIYLPEELEGV